MSEKEIVKNTKEIAKNSDSKKLRNNQESDDSLLYRPDYKMVVKQKLEKGSLILIFLIYTIGVIFVTLHYSKGNCG